jgi:8-oxo-dGTP pyrophosphatase MutT (NUDIX family)
VTGGGQLRQSDPPDPIGSVPPPWLTELAESASRMDVAPPLRPPPSGGRPSAVLILFGAGPGGPDLLFIQRSQGLRQHPGQPAFPGGAMDDADPGPAAAALREAAEEAGVDPRDVEVLATLPELFIAHSGFRVVPVLAWWRSPGPVSAVDPREVAAVERIGLAELADPASRVMVRTPTGWIGPGFRVKGLFIWGFTAALVDRLLTLGGWEVPWNTDTVHDIEVDGGPGELFPGTQDRPIP